MQSYASWIVIRRLRVPLIIIIVTFAVSILGMMMIPGQDDQGNVYHLNFFDAFYFVSYMASTIGFGESPYAFTYPQKLWVSFTIYLTVIGWFYGIGTIVALIQDKVLAEEISRSKFIADVKAMEEPFILIFGYNNVTKNLIQRLSKIPKRMVVIDKDVSKIDDLRLENYHPHIPAFHGDLLDVSIVEMAGVKSPMCESVVVVFEKEYKNTKIAMMCKYLNPNTKIIVRSNTLQNNDYLYTIGIDHIENPFKVISNRLYLALTAPHLWMLEMWVHGHPLRIEKHEKIPRGKFVIYGYGRMGRALEEGLIKANIEYVFINAGDLFTETKKIEKIFSEELLENKLIDAGIDDAAVIVAGTRDDMVNLAVIMLARKHNPNIYTIARENSLSDLNVFEAAQIDRNYILEEIVANKTYNYLAKPLANAFILQLSKRDNKWGQAIVHRIVTKLGRNPHLCEMSATQKQAFALYQELDKGTKVPLKVLKRSRADYKKNNALIFLLIKRQKEIILLPGDDFLIQKGDEMLIVCNDESEVDLAYILNNYYEFHYVMYGEEKITGILGLMYKNQKL
jgi:Trk K+ transport system NAD-binding subunit